MNNKLIPPPNNWQGLEVELSFENNSPDANIKTTTFEWLGENAATLNSWYKSGLYGLNGIFEGIPFRIEACNPPITIFNGCIDMTSEDTTFQCDIVKASCKETNRIQFLNDRAEGFTFAYLSSIGSIAPSDYVAVPYVISTIPDYLQVAILAVSFLEMIKIIQDAAQEISNITGELAGAIASSPFSVGLVAWYTIELVAYILYALFILLLTVNIFLMLVNEIIQPIKYKYGMKVKDLFMKACSYLNLSFSSTILNSAPYNNLIIIPKKSSYVNASTYNDSFMQSIFGSSVSRKYYDDTQNGGAYGYYEGTFAQLIREMEDVFNAKIVIRNNTLFFERWDFWNLASGYTIPNISSDPPFDNPYGTNAHEVSANYFVVYGQDSADTNTYDQYDGTSCQMTLVPGVITNVKNVLLKGLNEKRLNFALAKRKTNLTAPENVINAILMALAPFFNALTSLVNGPSLPTNLTNNRIGAMLLSSDFTGMQKLVLTENPQIINGIPNVAKISIDNQRADHLGYTDAYFLAINYHSASWPFLSTPTNGVSFPYQYLTFKDKEVPLCCADFAKIKDNNIVNTHNNKQARIDSMSWNPFEETAKINYRIKEPYTYNLKQNFVIDGN